MDITKIADLMPVQPSKRAGVEFRSIAALLASPVERSYAWGLLNEEAAKLNPTCIIGIDSRGYIMGEAVATHLSVKFVMAAKSGKLPGEVIKSHAYTTEYDKQDSMEITKNIIDVNDRVIIVDDILATGGSAVNVAELVNQTGANLVGFLFLGQINGLNGNKLINEKFPKAIVYSICKFGENQEIKHATIKQETGQISHIENNGLIISQTVYQTREVNEIENIIFKDNNRIILMYHPSRRQHAKEIFLRFPNEFELQEISWKCFPDGWPDVKIMNPDRLINRHVVFLMACENLKNIMEQLFVCMILPAQFLKSLVIDINYFAPGTHERVTQPGVLATAETMSRLFSNIPHTKSGAPIIQITDLHALSNQFYFKDCFAHLISSIPMLLELKPNTTIVFPDDGAYKRYGPMILADNPLRPMLICTKMRENEKRSVKIAEWKNFPKHFTECKEMLHEVIIIDDLCHSGSTMIECVKELKKIPGIEHVDAWITHGVFEQSQYLHFLQYGKYAGYFREIHITNSLPVTSEIIKQDEKNLNHFKIHSLAKTWGSQILKLLHTKPVREFIVYIEGEKSNFFNLVLNNLFNQCNIVYSSPYSIYYKQICYLNIIITHTNEIYSIEVRWVFDEYSLKSRFGSATSETLAECLNVLIFSN